jgi:hypothetical protein
VTLPSGQLSNIPWRRSGVKYANNEAYFDVVEEVDAIIDKSGCPVTAEIQGYVRMDKDLSCNDQTWDIYVFIGEPKSCSHFITNGAKLRLSYKYIHIPSLDMSH